MVGILLFLTVQQYNPNDTLWYQFNRIAVLDEGIGSLDLWVGDLNHNGKDELIFEYPEYPRSESATNVMIWEGDEKNHWVQTYTYVGWWERDTSISVLRDVADTDKDDLSKLLVSTFFQRAPFNAFDGVALLVSEGLYSYPSSIVWQDTMVSPGHFHDLDSDGWEEIFCVKADSFLPFPKGIVIYKNQGNNNYIPVFTVDPTDFKGKNCSADLLGDFDNDGKSGWFNIISGESGGDMDTAVIWEYAGNNDYKVVWKDTQDWIALYDIWLGNDTDGDGKVEIFLKNYWYGPNPQAVLSMYEATGNDSFKLSVIDTLEGSMSMTGGVSSCGDVDGDGREEVAVSLGTRVVVYKAVGDDEYQRVWEWENDIGKDADIAVTACHDFNKNGYDEIVISADAPFEDPKTYIFEIDKTSIAETKTGHFDIAQLSVVPNPVKNSAIIKYSIPKDGEVKLIAYDVVGRTVKKLVDNETKAGTYAVTWTTKELPAGFYFIRLKTPVSTLTEKVIITR